MWAWSWSLPAPGASERLACPRQSLVECAFEPVDHETDRPFRTVKLRFRHLGHTRPKLKIKMNGRSRLGKASKINDLERTR